jgi:TPR repeat protein
MMRPHIAKGLKRVVLVSSWTDVAPDRGNKSLAQKLSDALKGFPVSGMDGFLWIAKDGAMRTTRQAYTVKQGYGPYSIADGDEVMVSLAAGWPAELEDYFVKERNAEGIMQAGAGRDIYSLCPDRALQAFEAAAKLSHPIAAYNAAVMRLERNGEGDIEAATALLSQAASAGDKKSRARLQKLKQKGP